MPRLENRIALVTGGGNGIGRATADVLAAEGAHVHICDIDGPAAEAAVTAIRAAGGAATAHTTDVTRTQDVSAMLAAVKAAHGRLDVVVNNAGMNIRNDFRHLTDAEWTKIRELNLDAVMRIARDSLDLLKVSGRGSLVNVASIMGHRGLRQLVAYSATKGAVAALTRGLAVEYAAFNVRVNTVSPGFVHTALTQRILRNPQITEALVGETILRRLGEPAEIARAILFFASDDSSYCTGAELIVDGGMSASM